MREKKSEAKGDPGAGRAVPSPTRHSPTAPKEGQAGDGIHQPSGCSPRQGELMPQV